jgi:hypothetical protein
MPPTDGIACVRAAQELQDWVNEDVEKTTTADGKKHP